MFKTLISSAVVVAALAVAGCGSSNDSTPTTETVVQTVTETVATTAEPPAEELTTDDQVAIAAANLAAARYCTAALGHVVGELPDPPSNAIIDRHIKTANRVIEIVEAKPDAARDAARELIRIARRCQSPVAGDVKRAMG